MGIIKLKMLRISWLALIIFGYTTQKADNKPSSLPKPHGAYDHADYKPLAADAQIPGKPITGIRIASRRTAEIMAHKKREEPFIVRHMRPMYIDPDRRNRPQNSQAFEAPNFPNDLKLAPIRDMPLYENEESLGEQLRKPQIPSINFLGGQFSEVLLFPPDSMGALGPSQFIMSINGLIRTFNKTTGLADGILNIDTDTFFGSARGNGFTSDPRIRYDRLSGRWFIIMINVPPSQDNNRIMVAFSNSGVIAASTVWTFFYFQAGVGTFYDYPTLGIDKNALYIGGVTFSNTDTGKVFVINKASIFGPGTIIGTEFDFIIDPVTGVGPYCPQGVDNFDPTAASGYFIGVDNATFGTLVLRRINSPGSTSPTISGNIILSVPSTQFPINVPHLGNNHGTGGYLDGIDDRLMMAVIRKNQLWTTHNIGVDNTGVSSNKTAQTRNGSRWYQIDVTTSTPVLKQSGTLFMPSVSNTFDQRSYWMPSVMVSGQGHMGLGCSQAGSQEYINAAAAGRLVSDSLGVTQAATQLTLANTAYNPAQDPGGQNSVRRWGDFSFTSLDPCDDMTLWTIQEYCNAANSWGVRVVKLLAPPPAKPFAVSPSSIAHGLASVVVTITGQQINGSGFYDPGTGFVCRLQASVSDGVVVKSVLFVDPTHIKLTLSTQNVAAGKKNVTITNPDGQSIVASGLITVT